MRIFFGVVDVLGVGHAGWVVVVVLGWWVVGFVVGGKKVGVLHLVGKVC